MQNLEIEAPKDDSKCCKTPVVIGVVAFVLLAIGLTLSVILTLPKVVTCRPHDARYFVELVPNATISRVDPPFICLAQGSRGVQITGQHFLRFVTDEVANDAKYFFLTENQTATNETISSVAGQGIYSLDGMQTARAGPNFASHLHKATCQPSDDECKTLAPTLPSEAVELPITWGADCVEGVTHVKATKVDDADSTYDLRFPEDGLATPLWRQKSQSCRSFNVTFPTTVRAEIVVPELFVAQPRLAAPHAIDADASRELCQHNSFGKLVLMPAPTLADLKPALVCRQDTSAVRVLTGRHIVQAKATTSDAGVKAAHIIARVATPMSMTVWPSAANNFSFANDFSVAGDKLALHSCKTVLVDQYASVEACDGVNVTLSGADHYYTMTMPDVNETMADVIAPLSALSVRNPSPIDCISESTVEFRTVERPVVRELVPPMICVAESSQSVEFVAASRAAAFAVLDQANVTLAYGAAQQLLAQSTHADCIELPLRQHAAQLCRSLTAVVPLDAAVVETDVPALVVGSPHFAGAQCDVDAKGELVLVPKPTLVRADPPFACQDSTVNIALSGRYLVEHQKSMNGAVGLPKVTGMPGSLLFEPADIVMESCANLPVRHYARARNCSTLQLAYRPRLLSPLGEPLLTTVALQNPAPVACSATRALEIMIVRRPTLQEFLPSPLVCLDQGDVNVTLSGEGFVRILNEMNGDPTVLLTPSVNKSSPAINMQPTVFDDCTPLPNTQRSLVSCKRVQITMTKAQFGMFVGEVYDVSVALPGQQDARPPCITPSVQLALIAAPVFDAFAPSAVACVADGDANITLVGSNFVHWVDTLKEQASIRVRSVTSPSAPVVTLSPHTYADCVAVPFSELRVDICKSITATLSRSVWLSRKAELLSASVVLPVQLCTSNSHELMIVDKPTLTSTNLPAPIVCLDNQDVNVTVTGTGFLTYGDGDSVLGVDVRVPTNATAIAPFELFNFVSCQALPFTEFTARSCSQATFTLRASELASRVGSVFTISVRLPKGLCSSSTLPLALVSKPTFTQEPLVPAVCSSATVQSLTYVGDWLLTISGGSFGSAQTNVELTTLPGNVLSILTPALTDCDSAISLGNGVSFRRCRRSTVSLSNAQLSGTSQFSLRHAHPNPLSACKSANSTRLYAVVQQPVLTSAMPMSICLGATGSKITVTGQFDVVAGVAPFLEIQGVAFPNRTATNCGAENAARVARCTSIVGDVTAELTGSIAAGPLVINMQVNAQCGASLSNAVFGLPTPNVDFVTPPRICHVTMLSAPLAIAGSRFARPPPPTISIASGGSASFPLTVASQTGCVVIPMAAGQEQCTNITVNAFSPQSLGLLVGDDDTLADLAAANDACSYTDRSQLSIVPVPLPTGVEPPAVCFDRTTPIAVVGTRFSTGLASVRFIHTTTRAVVLPGSAALALGSLNNTRLSFVVNMNAMPVGVYDVEVTNVQGCSATLPSAFRVHPVLIVAFAAPPVLYSGATTKITVYSSGLLAPVDSLILRHSITSVELVIPGTNTTHAVGDFNKIFAIIPAGRAAGLYDVELRSSIGCRGIANEVIGIASALSVSLIAADPAFVFAGSGGGIRVTASSSGAVLERGVGVYLSPNSGNVNDVAIEVGSTVFSSPTALTGVVDGGNRVGSYDVIVVNPSRTVGAIRPGLVLTPLPLPRVRAIIPVVWEAGTSQDFVIDGSNLPAASNATVTLSCRFGNATTTVPTASICPTGQCASAGGVSFACPRCTSSLVVFRTMGSGVVSGSVCTVTIIDAANSNAAANFQSLSVKNPSGKFSSGAGFANAPVRLNTARHALATFGLRASDALRSICAVGGSSSAVINGAAATALATIECSAVAPFGDLSAFVLQPQRLATPVAYPAATVVGRFVYVVGGHTGGATGVATSTVQRAYLLSPDEAPAVTLDINFDPMSTATFGGGDGLYYYSVSCVYGAADATNPNGESLPSNVVAVKVPKIAGISLILSWGVGLADNITAYRVYRTSAAGDLSTNMLLHAELDAATACVGQMCRFVELGANSTLPLVRRVSPLVIGTLGNWVTLQSLSSGRFGVSLTTVPARPAVGNDTRVAMFAIGGHDGTSAVATVQRMIIAVDAPQCDAVRCTRESHALSNWLADAPLPDARAFGEARVVTRADFGGLTSNARVIVLANGVTTASSGKTHQANMVGGDSYNCDVGANCLAWIAPTESRQSGSNKQSCYLLRSNTHVWLAGGSATTFSFANNFGMATADDDGQELVTAGYMANGAILLQGTQGLNTRQALPSAVASSSCIVENGNLYLVGGYTGTSTVTSNVQQLRGV